jgi:DNA-binding NarL/FixJ family response regulator
MSSTDRRTTRRPSLLAELTGVRVHVISDEPVVRAGVRCLLADRGETVTCADDVGDPAADVVLYDVIGLSLSGCQALETVVTRYPGRVLALSRTGQPWLTARALSLGAIAAVPLGAGSDELAEAVHDLFEGRFHDGSATDLANQRDRDHRLGGGACLSPREQDVLSLIVAGASNHQISAELNIKPNTVKTFIRSAYQKIGVSTRAQAAAWGVDHGLPTQHVRS